MTISVDIIKDPVISLKARRTLDGNVMIFDHEDIDIFLSVEGKKCLTFPKGPMNDKAYQAQDRIFEYLAKRGIIEKSSVRGGNIHGSLEAKILDSKVPGVDGLQACLYAINEYMGNERPFFKASSHFEDDRLDYLLRPAPEDSTELGDVPQEPQKGSLHPGIRPYGFVYNYSLVRESQKEDK